MPTVAVGCRRCSTPFGITEVGTERLEPGTPSIPGAQRLSASLRSAPRRTASLRMADWRCSTPFGITEVGTDGRVESIRRRRCAQRLSASLRSARVEPARVAALVRCSTPFGITEVGTMLARPSSDASGVCSTPFGITEVGTRQSQPSACDRLRECSTPFGITEVGTRYCVRLLHRESIVLNAFRHH